MVETLYIDIKLDGNIKLEKKRQNVKNWEFYNSVSETYNFKSKEPLQVYFFSFHHLKCVYKSTCIFGQLLKIAWVVFVQFFTVVFTVVRHTCSFPQNDSTFDLLPEVKV